VTDVIIPDLLIVGVPSRTRTILASPSPNVDPTFKVNNNSAVEFAGTTIWPIVSLMSVVVSSVVPLENSADQSAGVLSVVDGLFADHINHNTFDNRKANLRPATQTQNNRNRRKFSGQSNSKYKGVYWKKHIKKWVAQIGVNRKVIHLGCFKKEIDAARAYDEGAKKYHGEFASLNFPL